MISSEPVKSASLKVPFCRPCWVEIDLAYLRKNFRAVRAKLRADTPILAVVKANAYGHGVVAIAKTLIEEGAACLGVSSIEEGIVLRESGITAPILILGGIFPFENFSYLFDYGLTPTIASIEAAQALQKAAEARGATIGVHLKIDSGFGRIGVSLQGAQEFLSQIVDCGALKIEGLYTHFSSADIDVEQTKAQTQGFMQVVDFAKTLGLTPPWVHLANSSALLRFPETHGTLVRPGLALYGIMPYIGAEDAIVLEPVLAWKTRIVYLKWIPEKYSVSYARTWQARRATRVATLAVGYADGYPRLLSNRSHVLIGGRRASVIGRITMDLLMVDVTNIPEVGVGDEATLIGRQQEEVILASDLARLCQTNPYEIVCRIGSRVPRVILNATNSD